MVCLSVRKKSKNSPVPNPSSARVRLDIPVASLLLAPEASSRRPAIAMTALLKAVIDWLTVIFIAALSWSTLSFWF
ncbi:hypothetical protein D3C77_698830 [compost metagenome]